MRRLCLFYLVPILFLLLGIHWNATAQNCNPGTVVYDPNAITIPNNPNTHTFDDLLGINAGQEWDQFYNGQGHYKFNPAAEIFNYVRSFHTMESDYPCGDFPTDGGPDFCAGSGCGWGRMNNYVTRYDDWDDDVDYIIASLESIKYMYENSNGGCSAYSGGRSFPDKWFTRGEWGTSNADIRQNARDYGRAFIQLFCPDDNSRPCLVDMLELGNEPWGEPGVSAYHAICRGIIDACVAEYGTTNRNGWRMQLSSAAFQAYQSTPLYNCGSCNYSVSDYVGTMLPTDVRNSLSALNIHPYSFENCSYNLTEHPESSQSDFQRLKSMIKWAEDNGMANRDLNVTEYGWDEHHVGRKTQAIYNIRATLMLARWGVDRAVLYETIDNPSLGNQIYASSGIFDAQGFRTAKGVKPNLLAFAKFKHLLGDKIHIKSIEEQSNGAYAYLLGDSPSEPTHVVVWLGKDTNDGNLYNTQYVYIDDIAQQYGKKAGSTYYRLDDNASINLSTTSYSFGNAGTQRSTSTVLYDMGNTWRVRATRIPYLIPLVNNNTGSGNIADIDVNISANKTHFYPYTKVEYTVTAKNVGTKTISSAYVELDVPSTMAYTSPLASANNGGSFTEWCSSTNKCNRWTVGHLSLNETATLTITYYQLASYNQTVSAELTYSYPTDQNLTNNEDAVTIIYGSGGSSSGGGSSGGGSSSPPPSNDLVLSMDAPTYFQRYTNVDFEIEVDNNSNSAFSNIVVKIPMPSTMAYTSASSTYGQFYEWCSGGVKCREWRISYLPANTTARLTLRYYQLANYTQNVSANITSSSPTDDNSSNNSASVTLYYTSGKTDATPEHSASSFKIHQLNNEQLGLQLYHAHDGPVELAVYNTMGQLIHQKKADLYQGAHFLELTVPNLATGIYFIRMKDAEGNVQVEKVVR